MNSPHHEIGANKCTPSIYILAEPHVMRINCICVCLPGTLLTAQCTTNKLLLTNIIIYMLEFVNLTSFISKGFTVLIFDLNYSVL